jgi:hypothetical protein
MRPDVAAFGALMFPTVLLARHCAWTRTPIRNIGFSRFPVSDPSAAFLPVPVSSQGTTRMSWSVPGLSPPSGLSLRLA